MMLTQPPPLSRQGSVWPARVSTCMVTAALLFVAAVIVAAGHAQGQIADAEFITDAAYNLHSNVTVTKGINYLPYAEATLDFSDVLIGTPQSNSVIEGDGSNPPRAQAVVRGEVSRTRTSTEYQAALSFSANLSFSTLGTDMTGNSSAAAYYYDAFYVKPTAAQTASIGLSVTQWLNELRITWPTSGGASADRPTVAYNITVEDPGGRKATLPIPLGGTVTKVNIPIDDFGPDALYYITSALEINQASATVDGHSGGLRSVMGINVPGINDNYGTMQLTDRIAGAPDLVFKDVVIPEPASVVLISLGGIALLGWMGWRRSYPVS